MGPFGLLGAPWALWAPNPARWVEQKFEKLTKINILALLGSNMSQRKLGFRAGDHHGELCAGILRKAPVPMSQMVGW